MKSATSVEKSFPMPPLATPLMVPAREVPVMPARHPQDPIPEVPPRRTSATQGAKSPAVPVSSTVIRVPDQYRAYPQGIYPGNGNRYLC